MKLRLVEKSHVLREKGGRKSTSGGDRVIKLVSVLLQWKKLSVWEPCLCECLR